MSAGIDYGLGMTNIDHATGIRYGVIPDWFEGGQAPYSVATGELIPPE